MTDAERAAAAWAELALTTITYDRWKKQGFTPGHWANAKGQLDMIGKNVVNPPAVPLPTATFGASLPTRLPTSTGTTRTAGSKAAFDSAAAASAPGDIISLTGNITGVGGSNFNLSATNGTALAPITVLGNGFTISTHSLFVPNNYIVIKNLKWTNCGTFSSKDGMKIDGSFVEIDGCTVYDNVGSGILAGSTCSHPQIWNSLIYQNGQYLNRDHGIYIGHVGTGGFGGTAYNGVIGNCLIYNNYGYNIQAYPDCDGLLVTACTVDAGKAHNSTPPHDPSDDSSYERGGIVLGGDTSSTPSNDVFVGVVSSNAPFIGWHMGSSSDPSAPSNANIYDCVAYNNSTNSDGGTGVTYTPALVTTNPNYTNQAGRDYRPTTGSSLWSRVNSARYSILPPTYRDGSVRVFPDAGSEPRG